MPHRKLLISPHSAVLTILLLGLFSAAAPALLAQEGEAEDVVLERDPRPKLFATDFTWYEPNRRANGRRSPRSLACTRAQPAAANGQIVAADYLSSGGYYADKYRRFKEHGVDGIAYLVTDRIPDSFEGDNLPHVAGFAADAGLDFFAYYDLKITSAKESGLFLCVPGTGAACEAPPGMERVPSYNLAAKPILYDQLREDLERIAVHLIQPHMNEGPGDGAGYLMLEDALGRRVLDEFGLPRPVIGVYIARMLADNPGNQRRLGELLDEVTEVYRGLGIGKPAFVLDVLFWATPRADDLDATYDPDLLDVFGDHAVAVTWYSFFDVYRGNKKAITNDGPRPPMTVWGRHLNQRYRQARAELEANGHKVMLWPGASTQIDTTVPKIEGCNDRGIEVVYHLRSAANWRTMLTRALINAWRPAGEGVPLQTVTIISNAGEWFEGGGLDDTAPDASGRCRFPWNSCGALLDVVAEEDRYVE